MMYITQLCTNNERTIVFVIARWLLNGCESSGMISAKRWDSLQFPTHKTLRETTWLLQLQPSSSWQRRRKRSKMFSFFCHSYNPHNPPQIRLDFRLSIQDCPRTSPALFDFHTTKLWQREKYGLGDGCTILFFSTDDGCTCWWRWLHQLRWVISWFEGLLVRVEQCAEFGAIPSRNTPFDAFHQFIIRQEWRVEHRKIPRLPGSLDHYTAPK